MSVLVIRALLVWVFMWTPDIWKSQRVPVPTCHILGPWSTHIWNTSRSKYFYEYMDPLAKTLSQTPELWLRWANNFGSAKPKTFVLSKTAPYKGILQGLCRVLINGLLGTMARVDLTKIFQMLSLDFDTLACSDVPE